MPPIQTPPLQSRARSISSSAAQKPPSKRRNLSPDILELSPDVHTHVPPRRRKSLTKYKLKLKAPIVNKDVIEISSDEGEASLSQESTVANLRRQVKSLTRERDKYKRACNSLAEELPKVRAELNEVKLKTSQDQPANGRLVLKSSEVEDALNCEICTRRMYTPYLLPECGHTFCLSCLHDWFGTAHAHFIQANPNWRREAIGMCIAHMRTILRPEYLQHPDLHHHIQRLQQPVPEYTCPTCRKRVYQRPVEVYVLKSLVRTISAADKEESANIPPDRSSIDQFGRLADPWSEYFYYTGEH